MPQDQEPLSTSADAPPWAHARIADQEAVEYRRTVGSVSSAEGGEPISVQLVQRLELGIHDSAPGRDVGWVVVGGVRLSPAETDELCRLLVSARGLLEGRRE